MSASSKKKLRNAQAAEKMTERQMAEQKEAKKLKIYTIVFSVVIIAMLVIAIGFGAYNGITNSGIIERNTVAATVNGHDISSAELNYYYIDYINNFSSENSDWLAYLLDTTKPLDQQFYNEAENQTWADYFLDAALESAASTYALADAANAAGHTATDAELLSVDTAIQNSTFYAMYSYGFPDLQTYLKAMYGPGANEETYREYLTTSVLASSYYNYYTGGLSCTEDEIKAADAENPLNYNSYSYNYYYVPVSDYLIGGTTGEDGAITYSDAENEAARAAAEEAAKGLIVDAVTDAESFDAAIALIDAESTSFPCEDYLYKSLLSVAQEWISDPARKAGDKNYFAYTTHTHAEGETHSEDEDTSAFDEVKGYYVVLFNGMTDNTMELVNVRHALITEGGTYNSSTGRYDYTDDMAAAKAKAEDLLAQWQAGDATEETFIELAKANSSDGNASTGGLYENVYPGQMMDEYNDWCFDPARKTGDTGIVKTVYGYHIMYFVGNSGTTYRNHMIEEELLNGKITEWYDGLTANVTSELKETKHITTDLILNAA